MKFYAIPPNKHLAMMDNGNAGYFCLAHHFFNDTSYRDYFLNLRKHKPDAFITLDNGAAEHSLVTEDILIEAVKELKPNEVIAPDVLFDCRATLDNFFRFVNRMNSEMLTRDTGIFGCPQGSSREEWLYCYMQMTQDPNVTCIGLSKIAVPKCWNDVTGDKMIGVSRNACVQELKDRNILIKPLHLLGMGEHNEFDYYLLNNIPNIRSSDSCYTILAAIHGISFEEGNTTRIPTENAYFDVILTNQQHNLATKNIEYLKTKYKNI
jgi:hypothetical protein